MQKRTWQTHVEQVQEIALRSANGHGVGKHSGQEAHSILGMQQKNTESGSVEREAVIHGCTMGREQSCQRGCSKYLVPVELSTTATSSASTVSTYVSQASKQARETQNTTTNMHMLSCWGTIPNVPLTKPKVLSTFLVKRRRNPGCSRRGAAPDKRCRETARQDVERQKTVSSE